MAFDVVLRNPGSGFNVVLSVPPRTGEGGFYEWNGITEIALTLDGEWNGVSIIPVTFEQEYAG